MISSTDLPGLGEKTTSLCDGMAQIIACLPEVLTAEIRKTTATYPDLFTYLAEIRLRADRIASLSYRGSNLQLPVVLSREDLEACFHRLCRGSVYAYRESLSEGYLMLWDGFRAGVAGRAVTEHGRILGISDISSLSIRIARQVRGAGDYALQIFRRLPAQKGLLIYSPPGVGKTTLLRDLALSLSSGKEAKRVVVVDSRGEFFCPPEGRNCLLDILLGFPKAEGIEIAIRTLSPEVILCDEIGSQKEAEALLTAEGAGVPLIASAHGSRLSELIARPAIRLLWESHLFAGAIGLSRDRENRMYYTFDPHTDGMCAS